MASSCKIISISPRASDMALGDMLAYPLGYLPKLILEVLS